MNDEDTRRAWVIPPVSGLVGDIRPEYLDLADEDDRRLLLLLGDHPEVQSAIDDDVHEIAVAGRPISPQLHLAMHEVVANQIWEAALTGHARSVLHRRRRDTPQVGLRLRGLCRRPLPSTLREPR